MEQHLRRLVTPAMLIGIMVFPLAMPEQAQPGSQKQQRATQQTRTTDATQSAMAQPPGSAEQTQSTGQGRRGRRGRRSEAKVTVVRRLNRVRLSAAAIRTIRTTGHLRRVVAVQGTSIRPLSGSSLWQLSNGGYIVVGGSTVEPLASEVYTRHFGNGDLMVWACYCPGYDANKDDGCKFEGPANALSCSQSGGVNCTCKFEDFMITTDGAVIGFEGPLGN